MQLYVAFCVVVLLTLIVTPLGLRIEIGYEKASLSLMPSAARAYNYGVSHFDAQSPGQYDLGAAEYFFREAFKLDPTLPYIHHEFARIYFLRGDFSDAIMQIDEQIAQEGDKTPNSYYVRGLIEGYMGDYANAAKDYEHFLQFDPHDWAAINDYAWVLLKSNRFDEAARITSQGLTQFPDNIWLLNSNAIALFEGGHVKEALAPASAAAALAQTLTEADWLHAYPGNDPKSAPEGIRTFQTAAEANLAQIKAALASSTRST